ncbi:hypothetical protein BDV95DRAFT_568082 [Massariosphaeria phaeospora]|uniref:PD-(D/E)XK nuclease-like domain-containing protein n=1 Tax=Massariosphaeria phaeospora TaxID=100035 RepID=A0A7C8I7S6_9PLEO|nr:hypothetical protein BDV95DRAFT_568082 [Massariosphaeria phaeospora]
MPSPSPLAIDLSRASESPTNRIEAWLQSVFDSPGTPTESRHPLNHDHLPPPLPSPSPLQRKRASDDSGVDMDYRGDPASPSKRQRTGQDGRSAAEMTDSFTRTETAQMTSTAASNRSNRSKSPARQKAALVTARPAIVQHSIAVAPDIPEHMMAPLQGLRMRMRNSLHSGYVPAGLKDKLLAVDAFKKSFKFDPIEEQAYAAGEQLPTAQADEILRRVKEIFRKTQHCQDTNKDENGWCVHVVLPLLDLVNLMYGQDRWMPESVQTQGIDKAYLSYAADFSDKDTEKSENAGSIFRKTDFCFAYSPQHEKYEALYNRLRKSVISHTTDMSSQCLALFSGIEVKKAAGSLDEAQLQISIWMAASLRQKAEMALRFAHTEEPHGTDSALQEPTAAAVEESAPPKPDLSALIEPAITIVGREHKLYYAFLCWDTVPVGRASVVDKVQVLFDNNVPGLFTDSVPGIFRLARLYGNILEYGMDEGIDGFWGRFMGPVLERVAKDVEARRQR